jgi:hypothetical protein
MLDFTAVNLILGQDMVDNDAVVVHTELVPNVLGWLREGAETRSFVRVALQGGFECELLRVVPSKARRVVTFVLSAGALRECGALPGTRMTMHGDAQGRCITLLPTAASSRRPVRAASSPPAALALPAPALPAPALPARALPAPTLPMTLALPAELKQDPPDVAPPSMPDEARMLVALRSVRARLAEQVFASGLAGGADSAAVSFVTSPGALADEQRRRMHAICTAPGASRGQTVRAVLELMLTAMPEWDVGVVAVAAQAMVDYRLFR